MGTITELTGADVLSDTLLHLGLTTRLFCHSELEAPWCLAFPASALAHFHYVQHGSAWVRLYDSGETHSLAGGDLVVLPHGARYQIADTPKRAPIPFSKLIPQGHRGCVIVQSGTGGATTSMLCGAFSMQQSSSQPLLRLLPKVLRLRPADSQEAAWVESTLRQLAAEARGRWPGHEIVVSRLTDVLFVQVLRTWLNTHQGTQGNWMAALRDPQMGKALAQMHEAPAHPWTIQELASHVGLSRSPFASRFARLVGESPMAYLTRLRMTKAASLLRQPGTSLIEAAAQSGYQSEAAFSKAFRRHFGMPPGQYRKVS